MKPKIADLKVLANTLKDRSINMPKTNTPRRPSVGSVGNPGVPNKKPAAKPLKSVSASEKNRLGRAQSIPKGDTQNNIKP